MRKAERFLERKIFLKRQHIEIIRREIRDLQSELKRLRTGSSAAPNTKQISPGMNF